MLLKESSIRAALNDIFGGSPHFPSGYKLRMSNDHFSWIEDRKQYVTQGVFVYRYPVPKDDPFTVESIIAKRNQILQENVPGMFENTYMTTAEYITPTVEFIKYRGREFAQTRGYWEVYNDFMGGPFVSHSFYSPDGSDIIVLEAFVYAPRYDKRQYLRQVESILYSFVDETDKVDASGMGYRPHAYYSSSDVCCYRRLVLQCSSGYNGA